LIDKDVEGRILKKIDGNKLKELFTNEVTGSEAVKESTNKKSGVS
jgi:hypothetical protein